MSRIRSWVFLSLFIGLVSTNVASVPLSQVPSPVNQSTTEIYLPLVQRLSTDSLDGANIFLKKRAWATQEITSYEYTLARLCFCPPPFRARIRVENGLVTQITDIDSGQPLTADSGFGLSVDALYVMLTEFAQQDLHQFEYEFDPVTHYPTYFASDYQSQVADDEIFYWAEDLVILNQQ